MIRETTYMGELLPTQISIAFVDEDNLNNVPVAYIETAVPPPTRPSWTREQYLREFKTLTAKMLEITTKKNNDYGGANDPFKNFRTFGELGILVRMSDKFARLQTAIQEKRAFEVDDESLEDTYLDLANYALLGLCYRRGA